MKPKSKPEDGKLSEYGRDDSEQHDEVLQEEEE